MFWSTSRLRWSAYVLERGWMRQVVADTLANIGSLDLARKAYVGAINIRFDETVELVNIHFGSISKNRAIARSALNHWVGLPFLQR